MPPERPNAGSPEDWLRHARSDLSLSRVPRPPGALLEGLCFHAQQAAEKALKAVLVVRNTPFPRTHSIRALLDLIPAELCAPVELDDAAILTEYAVMRRYPGIAEPADEQEYREAVRLAEVVVSWAEAVIRGEAGNRGR